MATPAAASSPGRASLSSTATTTAAASQQDRGDTLCQYMHRVCTQSCVRGYNFCIKHILEDKAAPYKQCAYMTKAGRRCPAAAPKLEKKDGFCTTHNRKSMLARQRLARKRRPGETAESLLEELVTLTSGAGGSGQGAQNAYHQEHRRSKTFTDSVASRALEYASSSDSESELGALVEQTWRDDGDSDAESIDSDQEDLLKYAGVYTTEEVAQILRDKLIRLQALYIDQFKRLKHVLLVKRRQYLRARGPERESFGGIKLYKRDPTQKDRYNKLRALQQYHRKAGKEALLQRQSTERRIQASADGGATSLSPPRLATGSATTATTLATAGTSTFPACSFLDDGVRCSVQVVPLSKFCQKHILHDPCQLLYRPCPFADSQCGRPVPTLLNTEFCSLHQPLPPTVKVEDEKPGCDEAGVETSSHPPQVSTTQRPPSSCVKWEESSDTAGVMLEVKPELASPVQSHGDVCGQLSARRSEEMDTSLSISPTNTQGISSGMAGLDHSKNSGNSGDGFGKREAEVKEEEGLEDVEGNGNVMFTLGEEEDENEEEAMKQGR